MRLSLPALLLLAFPVLLSAQDTRQVTEPVIPTACVTLPAQLTSVGHTLAEADENKPDTARIQKAIDHCAKGQGVLLQTSGKADAFLSGPLELRSGVTLIVGKGVTLYASRDPLAYELQGQSGKIISAKEYAGIHCGTITENGHACLPLIAVQNVRDSAVMGEGVIDGRGGEKLIGYNYTWWELAEAARKGGRQQAPRLVVADYADNFTLYKITLKNSPNFHVTYNHGNGFTVWGLKIDTPQRGARNTDGVDPGNGSKNITITHSWIRTGDDNVAIKGGGEGIRNMTVSHSHFYWGHGMSIGSETDGGVSAIRVEDLSLDGPDNGIRIKSNGSRGGLTQDVVYDDVCVRNSPNPITLDTGYTAAGTVQGDHPPTMRQVTLHNVRVSGGGKITFNGYDAKHRIATTLDGVLLTDPAAGYRYLLQHSDLTLGPGAINLQLPAGEDSTIAGKPASGQPEGCAEKFLPFPQDSSHP